MKNETKEEMTESLFSEKDKQYTNFQDTESKASDLQLMYCGKERCHPGHKYGPNKRDVFLIHIVYSGEGTLSLNGDLYQLSAGNAFLLYPNTVAWYEADLTNPWSYFWLACRGIDTAAFLSDAGFSPENPVRILHNPYSILQYINKILEKQGSGMEAQLSRIAYLHLFFANLIRDKERTEKTECPAFSPREKLRESSRYVREYMEHHFGEEISIHLLAEKIGVHRAHLFNSFKTDTGYSPKEYLLYIRIQNAKALLRRTKRPISEIAAFVGYHDPLSFSKIFRKKMGISPQEYRNMKEENLYNRSTGEYLKHLYS